MPIYHVEKDMYEFTKQDKNNKSNEFSPEGYTWVGNTIKIDEKLVNYYKLKGCILLETAYDTYENLLNDCYAIYKKI